MAATGSLNNPGMAIARLVHLVKHACVHPYAQDPWLSFTRISTGISIIIIIVVKCNMNFDLDVIYDVISLDWKMMPYGKRFNIFLITNQQDEIM